MNGNIHQNSKVSKKVSLMARVLNPHLYEQACHKQHYGSDRALLVQFDKVLN